ARHEVGHDGERPGFLPNELNSIPVVARQIGQVAAGDQRQSIAAYAAGLSALRDVQRVDAVTGSYVRGQQVAPPNPTSVRFAAPGATWLSVIAAVEPYSRHGEALVRRLRDAHRPPAVMSAAPPPSPRPQPPQPLR